MQDLNPSDVAAVRARVESIHQPWPEWHGGWPEFIDGALIDAVLSIRARYGSSATTGVRGAVNRYLAWTNGGGDDLARLAEVDCHELQALISKQKTSGNPKARAITEAAARLHAVGVRRAADLDAENPLHKRAYTGVVGLGAITWTYFTMLLGTPSIKADTWIVCFTHGALGRRPSSAEAKRLLEAVAERLGVGATALDQAVWQHSRKRGHSQLGCTDA